MTDFQADAVTILTGAVFVLWLAMLAMQRKGRRK